MRADIIEIFEIILLLDNGELSPCKILKDFSHPSSNFHLKWNKFDICSGERHEHEEKFLFLYDSSLSSYKFDDQTCNFVVSATATEATYSAIDWGVGTCNKKIVAVDGMNFCILCGDTLEKLESYSSNIQQQPTVINYLHWFDNTTNNEDGTDENQILVGLRFENSSTVNILFLTDTKFTQYVLPSTVEICCTSQNQFPTKVNQEYQKFYSQYLSDMGLLMVMSNVSNDCALFRPNFVDWEWELFSTGVSLRLPTVNENDTYLDTYPLGSCVIHCSKNSYFDRETNEEWDPRPLIGGNTI
jgi:hypothetical protein